MLIEFRVANFRSFREEQVLSLVASKDQSHEGNLLDAGKFHLLKAAGVFGPNAAGKSNLVSAIRCMESFISASATRMNVGDRIAGISPFRLDTESAREPSRFEVAVLIDGTRFEYGFAATAERVHAEWLNAYPKGRRQRWLERKSDVAKEWVFRGPLRKQAAILRERTSPNGLILSRGAELNIEELSKVYLWFRERLWCLDVSYPPTVLMQSTAMFLSKNPEIAGRAGRLVKDADFGIDDLSVSEEPFPVTDTPGRLSGADKTFKEAVSEFLKKVSGQETVPSFAVRTSHRLAGSGGRVEFDLGEDESQGTQRLFALLGPFLDALAKGALVVVDELGCSMHPLLTRRLVELFQSPDANRKGAQLVVATHDSTLMDCELFRRDQIWIVEKNRKGASVLFSLYDFDTKDRPRSTTAFQRQYLAGRYGGVPKFGATFEDLEIE